MKKEMMVIEEKEDKKVGESSEDRKRFRDGGRDGTRRLSTTQSI